MNKFIKFSPLFLILLCSSHSFTMDYDLDSNSDTEFQRALEMINGKKQQKKMAEEVAAPKSKLDELKDKYTSNLFGDYLDKDAKGIRGSMDDLYLGVAVVGGIFRLGKFAYDTGESTYNKLTMVDPTKINLSNIDKISEKLSDQERIGLNNKKNALLKLVSPELFNDLLETKVSVLERSSDPECKLALDILKIVNKKYDY